MEQTSMLTRQTTSRCTFLVLLLGSLACGKINQQFQSDSSTSENFRSFTVKIGGQDKLVAHEAVIGPVKTAPFQSGVLLENHTPGQSVDSASADLKLYRAMDSLAQQNSANTQITFADFAPKTRIPATYLLVPSKELTLKPVAGAANQYTVYMNLYTPPPSSQAGKQVPIGSVSIPFGQQRAYVTLLEGVKLGAVHGGKMRGWWALYQEAGVYDSDAPTQTGLCEEYVRGAGSLDNQSYAFLGEHCRPKPSTLDYCQGDPKVDGCIGPAPVVAEDPFSDVGELDTTFLRSINAPRRVFTMHEQSPIEAKIEAAFIAKTISATEFNNHAQCASKFRASGRTLGGRINQHCHITPDPSPDPIDGMLTCRVVIQFIGDYTYQDKNCYVTGFFSGEEDRAETFLIYRE